MALPSNYTGDEKDPVTLRRRVQTSHDFAAILFEDVRIIQGGDAASAPIDVRADVNKTLFVKTTKNFSIAVQFTDDDSTVSPDWFDYCGTDGTAITFTCNNTSKAIPISCKGILMRVVMVNQDSAPDTPYVGVI